MTAGLPDGLTAHRLRDRRDLVGAFHDVAPSVWPEFMLQDPAGGAFYAGLDDEFADCAIAVVDADEQVVARALWIPFAWDGEHLSDRGWDWVIETGIASRRAGAPCPAASALEIGIHPSWRGRGLSAVMLDHMREAVAATGATDLFAPVRPSGKAEVPEQSMGAYLLRLRQDGLPEDPWLRVHVRAGGTVIGPCERSMTIEASVADWREWTGLNLSKPGMHLVPGALAPVVSDGSRVTYVEPNVWVRHRLVPPVA